MYTATSLMSLTRQQKIGQTELGDQNSQKIKIEDQKVGFYNRGSKNLGFLK
jgi:hypothetical protein